MALAEIPRHRFTVEEYHRMGEVGLLAPGARVELIEGEVIDMAPIGPDHAGTVDWLTTTLVSALAGQAIVRVQSSVRLSDISEPQPDVTVLRHRPDFYRRAHPLPDDVLVVIEVARSSLRFDRMVKLPLYARSGVAETWIVDLASRSVLVARATGRDGYEDVTTVGDGDTLTILDVTIDVTELLGQPPAAG